MSNRHYFIKASNDKSSSDEVAEPQVNRFSDVRDVDRRRHEVIDYMMLGYDDHEIAEYMGEDITTIRNDIAAIVKIGYEAREDDIEEVRDEIMKTYRMVKREGIRAFKKSQGTVETVTTKYAGGSGGGKGVVEEETVKTEEKAGDARFLKVVVEAAKEMGKVSGAQKHKEFQMQQHINQNSINIMSPDKTELPNDFDRWTQKPEGESLPSDDPIDVEEL